MTSMRYSIDGYNFAAERGYNLLGRICLTHSHPLQDVDAVFGNWDCSNKEYKFVEEYLGNVQYSAYDKLIQLCDALALPTGYCLMEKRIGKSIYSILPNVIENTFELYNIEHFKN